MKYEPKKHFDISKPRRLGPDPTSKPIIVGHHPMMPDPMIREDREKAPKPIKVTSDEDKPEPLSVSRHEPTVIEPTVPAGEQAKADDLPDLSDISAPHETSPALTPSAASTPQSEPPAHPIESESAPGAVFSPTDSTHEGGAVPPEPKKPQMPGAIAVAQPLQPVTNELVEPTPAKPLAGEELHIPAGHGHAAVHHKPRVWVWVIVVLIILAWTYAAVDILTDVKLPYEFFKSSTQ